MDRNSVCIIELIERRLSLSARRAWIEMLIDLVDSPVAKESLSARRAWIEMYVI